KKFEEMIGVHFVSFFKTFRSRNANHRPVLMKIVHKSGWYRSRDLTALIHVSALDNNHLPVSQRLSGLLIHEHLAVRACLGGEASGQNSVIDDIVFVGSLCLLKFLKAHTLNLQSAIFSSVGPLLVFLALWVMGIFLTKIVSPSGIGKCIQAGNVMLSQQSLRLSFGVIRGFFLRFIVGGCGIRRLVFDSRPKTC